MGLCPGCHSFLRSGDHCDVCRCQSEPNTYRIVAHIKAQLNSNRRISIQSVTVEYVPVTYTASQREVRSVRRQNGLKRRQKAYFFCLVTSRQQFAGLFNHQRLIAQSVENSNNQHSTTCCLSVHCGFSVYTYLGKKRADVKFSIKFNDP